MKTMPPQSKPENEKDFQSARDTSELSPLAKLSCWDTYFKYVGELSDYSYIPYECSFNLNRPSEIYLKAVSKDPGVEDDNKFPVNHG